MLALNIIIGGIHMEEKTKVKKPIFKKWWFWVIVIIIVVGVIGGSGDDTKEANAPESGSQEPQNDGAQANPEQADEEKPAEEEKTPIVVTADQMIAALKENALKASQTYDGAYVEVTGRLSAIDSSGDYFSISELDNEFSFDSIMCYIKEEHLETVSNFANGQDVTVIGTIKSVGEVLGYSLDVEQIK